MFSRSHAPRDNGYPSHHGRSFNSFGSPINLTAQATPTPTHPASRLYVENHDATAANFASFVCKIADGTSVTLTVPSNYAQMFEGAFIEISSVSGSGAAASTITAFWDDVT